MSARQPIPFPDRGQVEQLCRTRANRDNERWQQQVERRDALIRAGYTAGWHWGLVCGIVAGGVAVGIVWIVVWPLLQRLLAMAGVA